MISVYVTTDRQEAVIKAIHSQHRLNELVSISSDTIANADIDIINDSIITLPDWKNTQPPVLIPPSAFTEEVLLGIIYAKLSNYEQAYPFLQNHTAVLQAVDLLNRIQNGIEVNVDKKKDRDFISAFNNAIAMHYGFQSQMPTSETINNAYDIALALAPDDIHRSFVVNQAALFLLDSGNYYEAEKIIQTQLLEYLPQQAHICLTNTLCNVWLKTMTVPYDTSLLEKLKTNLWKCLEYYEQNNRSVDAAMVLNDAAFIATISNSFSEALGYSNRAIKIFDEEQLPELAAQAHLSKANMLQAWAKNDNPQFYKPAMQSYQEALKIFTREDAPDVFADIHHQLGIVYAAIPDEVKKKSVWAAVSVSSFNEALQYYNKIDFPYEFAMICHSFGNAYTKYPQALHTDNYDKALAWYREALDIRTADNYPFERVLTLSNYLEASWFAGNKNEFDEERYAEMKKIADEILHLTSDESIVKQVNDDMKKLEMLKTEAAINN